MRNPSKSYEFWHSQSIQPESLIALAKSYFSWLMAQGYAQRTIEDRRLHLRLFIQWCHERTITTPSQVTQAVLLRYQVYLYHLVHHKTNRPLSVGYRLLQLISICMFFRWLVGENYLPYDPALNVGFPKLPKRIPRHILTHEEVKLILDKPAIGEALGIRDRAILETFYSTGMRRQELISLTVTNIDFKEGTVMIVQGKNLKGRLIPIGDTALSWIERYLQEVRHTLAHDPADPTLFLNMVGKPLSNRAVNELVRKYLREAGLAEKGCCHLLRHTMATLMLENGADIRYIQEILGHAWLDTTQIYTKVSIRKLKEIHTQTHPAKVKPSKKDSSQTKTPP